MIKKQYGILFLLCSMTFATAQAEVNENSMGFALLKTSIEAVKAGTYTANKERIKKTNPNPSMFSTMTREAIEAGFDYAINSGLQATCGKTLCDGKSSSYQVDTHKIMTIFATEAAKLAASPAGLSKKKFAINVLRKMLEKNFALDTSNTNKINAIKGIASVAASLNATFYKEVEAGTVDWSEFKKLTNNKYWAFQSGIETATNIYIETALSQHFTNKHKPDKPLIKFLTTMVMIGVRPTVSYIANSIVKKTTAKKA